MKHEAVNPGDQSNPEFTSPLGDVTATSEAEVSALEHAREAVKLFKRFVAEAEADRDSLDKDASYTPAMLQSQLEVADHQVIAQKESLAKAEAELARLETLEQPDQLAA